MSKRMPNRSGAGFPSSPDPGHESAGESKSYRARLMAGLSITYNGRQYEYGDHRYDLLDDAMNYARLQLGRGRELPRSVAVNEEFVAPTEVEAERLAKFGITFVENAFHIRGFRYERLQDALNYAWLRLQGIAS